MVREACIFVVYMPTDSTSVPVINSSYEKRTCLVLNRKEGLYFLEISMLE